VRADQSVLTARIQRTKRQRRSLRGVSPNVFGQILRHSRGRARFKALVLRVREEETLLLAGIGRNVTRWSAPRSGTPAAFAAAAAA